MNGLALGPFFFAPDRLAVLAGLLVLLGAGALLARRADRRFDAWSTIAALSGLVAGRGAHVVAHWDSFATAPWRALAFWQGGFAWPWALAGAALASLAVLRRPRLVSLAGASLAAATLAGLGVLLLFPPPPSRPLPALTLRDLADRPVTLAARDGRPTVINLWATWCPPCRRELPGLVATARSRPDVRFVLADQGEDAAKVSRTLRAQHLDAAAIALDPAQRLGAHFATPGLPATFVFDSRGVLVLSRFGEIAPEDLEGALAKAQQSPR